MSRSIEEVATDKTATEIGELVENYMRRSGFIRTVFRGENVWRKGSGVMSGPLFMKIEPGEGRVHIEVWITHAVAPGLFVGEQDLRWPFPLITKNLLRLRLRELIALLRQ